MDSQNTAAPSEKHCAQCQEPTISRCSGCLGAPSHSGVVLQSPYYCSAKCQRANWNLHKTACRALQARIHLSRATTLIKAVIILSQKNAYALEPNEVVIDGNDVVIKTPAAGLHSNAQKPLHPFSVNMEGKEDFLDAVLLHDALYECMVYSYNLIKEVLKGVCREIWEISAVVANPKLRVYRRDPNGTKIEKKKEEHHWVYKVTLTNGEDWAIDITGARLGFSETILPWHIYQRDRIEKVIAAVPFGVNRQMFNHEFPRLPFPEYISGQLVRGALARAIDKEIPEWAKSYGGELGGILKGSDAAFETSLRNFTQRVDDILKARLARLYTHTETERRLRNVNKILKKRMSSSNWSGEMEAMAERAGLGLDKDVVAREVTGALVRYLQELALDPK